jgi:catechol 2,3-dioxygenase-like lactoylglutathione lyase family enzyme
MVDEAIPVLKVSDVARSLKWYERLGFVEEWSHKFGDSFPAFISVARHQGARLFLSEHEGDASEGALVYIRLADVDAVGREFGVDVLVQPWGREVHLTDPDGNSLRVGTPRPDRAARTTYRV